MKKLWKSGLSLVLALAMIVGMLPMSVFAATADKPLSEADGIVWLYDNNGGASDAFIDDIVYASKLDNLIRKAVGADENDDRIAVYYGKNNISTALGLLAASEALTDDITETLKAKKLISFGIGSENNEKWLAVRTIQGVNITVGQNGEIVISGEGAPADLADQIDAILADPSGYITIDHNGEADLSKTRHTVATTASEYHWPEAGEGDVVAGTVTVTVTADDTGTQKTGTANIVLRDTRGVVTDLYTDEKTGTTESKSYYEGEETPAAPTLPTNEYYACDAWELDGTSVDGNTITNTYVPNWTPKIDNDGDGTPDQLQSFTVTYYNDNQKVATYTVPYGTVTPKPDTPKKEDYSFGGWFDADGKLVAVTVVGDAVYYASWTQDPVVTYLVYDHNNNLLNSMTLTAKKIGTNTFYVEDISGLIGEMDGYIWSRWLDDDTEVFDFAKPITGDVTLLCIYWPDANNNKIIDGTKADPYHVYEYYALNSDGITSTKIVTRENILTSENYDPQSEKYSENLLGDYQKFVEWTVSDPVASNEGGTLTYTCKPVIITDANGNDIDDREEVDTVEISGLTLGEGECTFENGMLKISKDGYTGTIEITGLMYRNGVYSFTYNPAKTAIKVSPLWKDGEMSYYVAGITVDGAAVGAYDEDYNLVCEPTDSGIAMLADENVVVTVEYKEAVKFEANPAENELGLGKDTYSVEDVYNAAFCAPAFSDAITLRYKARSEGTVTVNTADIRSRLSEAGLGSMVDGVLKDSYTFNVTERYAEVTNPATYRSADDIANAFFDDMFENVFNDDGTLNDDYVNTLNFKQLLSDLEDQIEAEANLHRFGHNDVEAGKDAIVETLDVTYKTESQYVHTIAELTIQETREATAIQVKDSSLIFDYNAFTDADLLANVSLVDANGSPISGEVKLDTSYENKSVGTYTVTVSYAGNETYKESGNTFTLTIEKVAPTVAVDEMITVMKGNAYNPAPVVDPANARIVHIIAGIAADQLAIDGDELMNNQIITLADDEVEIKAWIKLPALYIQVVEELGYDLGSFMDIDDLEESLDKELDNAIWESAKSVIQSILDQLPAMIADRLALEDLEFDLKVRIDAVGEDSYPTDPGIYINMAANMPAISQIAEEYDVQIPDDLASLLEDNNYEPASDFGFIVISPMLPIPNSGGVELYYDGVKDTQNVFVFDCDRTGKALKVAVNGVALEGAEPFYYGITTRADATVSVPTAPGLYVAGYNYTTTVYNEVTGEYEVRRLGSDCAVIIVKQIPAELTVTGETVTYDGEKHLPTITVTDEDGKVIQDAAVTIISGNVDTSSATSVADLTANVNIDFPDALDELWVKFWNHLGKTAPDTATPDDVVRFLEWCKEQVYTTASEALEIMEGLGIPGGYVDVETEIKVENGIEDAAVTLQNLLDRATFYFDKLIVEVKKISDKTSDNISMSIKDLDEMNYTQTGYYLFAGIITDPDYMPEAATGLVIIKSADTYVMSDTHAYYDGAEHTIDIDDQTKRDGIVIIVDDNGDNTKVNFDLDNDMTAVLKAVLEEAGYTLYDGSDIVVGTAYTKGEAKINDLIYKVTAEFEEQTKAKVIDRVKAHWPNGGADLEVALEDAMDWLDEHLPNLVADLSEQLQELDRMDNDTLVIINGQYPVEVGEYQFYGYDYDVAVTSATLYIEPNEIVITPVLSESQVYVGAEVTLNYQVLLNGELIDENHDIYKALNIGYSISNVDALEDALAQAGTYTVEPTYTVPVNSSVTVETAELTVLDAYEVKVVVTPDTYIIGSEETVGITYEVTKNGELIDAESEDYIALGLGYTISGVDSLEEALTVAGEYTIEATYTAPDNGDMTATSAVLTVLPATADFNPFAQAEAKLDLESLVRIVIDVTIKNDYLDAADYIESLGVLVWDASEGITAETGLVGTTEQYNLNARKLSDNVYRVYTDGIPAKEYNDTLTLRLVVKLANGQYAYSPVFNYSVATYCYDMQNKSDENLKQACKALLNYGAHAQLYFNYRTDALVNANLSAEDQAMTDMMSNVTSYLDTTVPVDPNKTTGIVADTTVFTGNEGRLVLNGSTDIFIGIKLDETVLANATEMSLHYWTYDQYVGSDSLEIIESQKFAFAKCDPSDYNGMNIRAVYTGRGTAGKELGEGVYFCACVKTNDGNVYYSPVFVYSVETYCKNTLNAGNGLGELMQRLAVYGECAKEYFANLQN